MILRQCPPTTLGDSESSSATSRHRAATWARTDWIEQAFDGIGRRVLIDGDSGGVGVDPVFVACGQPDRRPAPEFPLHGDLGQDLGPTVGGVLKSRQAPRLATGGVQPDLARPVQDVQIGIGPRDRGVPGEQDSLVDA